MKKKIINNKTKALVTKSNELVEARYHFSLWETRVFSKLVSLIQPGDADFKKYKLQIKDMISFFGVNDNDAYAKIKAVPDFLLKKVVTIPYTDENGEERFLKTGLIAQASIPKKKEGFIELSFHPDLKPYLLQLKRKFLSYDIRNVLKISSVYSIRIYELLKQYEKIGLREFEIDTLKVILGISDKYKLYGHFKDRIIKKAQSDLKSHTDICFTFVERKQGRKVVALVFTIKKNIPKDSDLRVEIEENITTKIENIFKDWGLSSLNIKKYLKSYSVDYLEQKIKYVENQQKQKLKKGEKIAHLAAYFKSIVVKKDLVDYIEVEKIKKHKKQSKIEVVQTHKKNLELQIKALKKELGTKENAFVFSLFEQDPLLKETTLDTVKRNNPLLYNNKSVEEYFKSNPLFRAATIATIKKQYKNSFKEIQKEFEPAIEELKKQLNRRN